MSFKGIDIRSSGDRVIVRAFLLDSSNAIVTAAGATLRLYEVQSDGSLKSYDFSSNTFKATALTTETASLTHRQGNNNTTNTGVHTYALTTVSGFTRGNVYLAVVDHASAVPTRQVREFQYGEGEGDFTVDAGGQVTVGVNNDKGNTVLAGTQSFDNAGQTTNLPVDVKAWHATAVDVYANDVQAAAASSASALAKANANGTTLTTVVTKIGATTNGSLTADIAANLAAVQNIQKNTFIGTNVPPILELPDAGSEAVALTVTFADETGAPADIDAAALPTVVLVNNAGTSRAGRLSAWTHAATGKYTATYTNTSGDALENLHWEFTGTVNGRLRRHVLTTQLVDTTAVDFTSTDRTNLGAVITHLTDLKGAGWAGGEDLHTLFANYTPARALKLDNLDAAVTSRQPAGNVTVGGYAAGQDPGTYVLATPANKLATDASGQTTVGGLATAAKTDVENAVWNAAHAAHTTAGTFGFYVDGQISAAGGSSSLTAADIADAVWDEPIAGHLSAGSTGLKLNSAASAGDPWGTSLPGAYGPGTAGYLVGNVGSTVAGSLAGASNIVVIGIVCGQVMEVVRGDTYSLAEGREWRFTKQAGEPWPADLTGWTVTLTANLSPANRATGSQAGQATITLNGVVDVATGQNQSVYFEPDASLTGVLAIGVGDRGYRWDVQASKGASRATLRLGVMTVREDQTRT